MLSKHNNARSKLSLKDQWYWGLPLVKHRYNGIPCRHANPLVLNASAWDTGWTQNKTKVPRVISETADGPGQIPWRGGWPQSAEGDSGRLEKKKIIQEKEKPRTFYKSFLSCISPFVIPIIYSLIFFFLLLRVFKVNSAL